MRVGKEEWIEGGRGGDKGEINGGDGVRDGREKDEGEKGEMDGKRKKGEKKKEMKEGEKLVMQ